jgi:hypothetical protein
MAQSPLCGLSDAERARAFERFELLRPSLEEGVPLARVARDRGLALRTARRWAGQYRREGLAGLARKGRSDRGKRHLADALPHVWGEADWSGGSRARKCLVFQALRVWWPPAGPKSVVTT